MYINASLRLLPDIRIQADNHRLSRIPREFSLMHLAVGVSMSAVIISLLPSILAVIAIRTSNVGMEELYQR
jgi:hypothetical protein